MEKFEIDLRGENFLFNRDREPGKFGFSASCLVQAGSEEEAAKMAAILVRQNPLIRDALVEMEMARPVIRLLGIRKAGPLRSFWRKLGTRIEFHPED